VREYHSVADPHPPAENPQLHAIIHATVENQVAMGDEVPAKATLERLIKEGLTRHEAVHAIGSVLAGHIFNVMKEGVPSNEVSVPYEQQLRQLTAERWLSLAKDSPPARRPKRPPSPAKRKGKRKRKR
jgi:hypothetical protein